MSELGLLAGHFGDFLSQGSGLVAGTKLTDEAGAGRRGRGEEGGAGVFFLASFLLQCTIVVVF